MFRWIAAGIPNREGVVVSLLEVVIERSSVPINEADLTAYKLRHLSLRCVR